MKIGVLSDTHLRSPDPILHHILDELFADADEILHAGDIVSNSVLERLEQSNVIAVCGNMDDYEVAGKLPQTRIVETGGKVIGLIHGWGARDGLESRLLQRFEIVPDIIVYGHSHKPFWGKVDGVDMFNPGSASMRGHGSAGTVGLLKISPQGVETDIIPLKR